MACTKRADLWVKERIDGRIPHLFVNRKKQAVVDVIFSRPIVPPSAGLNRTAWPATPKGVTRDCEKLFKVQRFLIVF